MTDPKQPEHADPDGPEKGWSAADVDPDEYTDDDYAAQFPVVSQPGDNETPASQALASPSRSATSGPQ